MTQSFQEGIKRERGCGLLSGNTIGVTLKGNGQGRQGRTGEIKLLEGGPGNFALDVATISMLLHLLLLHYSICL